MRRVLSPPLIILIGVIALALGLAALLSDLLTGAAQLIALGMALGLLIGVPIGMAGFWLGFRRGEQSTARQQPPLVALTPEQSEMLAGALARQQVSPAAFGLNARGGRPITPVGGADLTTMSDESGGGSTAD